MIPVNMELLEHVVAIAREAGAAIMAIYGTRFSVNEKADQSPLTEADSAAHSIITRRLRALTPPLPVLSEEGVEEFQGNGGTKEYWLADPLDGTKEFIKRNGEFTVNIALVEAGHPVLGVVHAPALGVTYSAAKGLGAHKSMAGQPASPIRVAAHQERTPWRVVGSRSHAGDTLDALLQRLGPHEMVPMGSSLKMCMVAEGAADVYPRLGPTSLWDTAAAQYVVEQAGGRVIQLSGLPLSYANPAVTLNPHFVAHGISTMDWPGLVDDLARSASFTAD